MLGVRVRDGRAAAQREMRLRTEIGGQSANVPIPAPVASGPEWYPNFAEHWLFWLAFGLGVFALIFAAAAIRRRLGRHVTAVFHNPVDTIADVLDVEPGEIEREQARRNRARSR
jgi:hypothetical protein